MTTKKLRRPRGFTLVEMLVVIAIIGVLVAILVPTLFAVIVKARNTKIANELSELHKSMEAYKQKFGDYPPDFTTFTAADVNNANHLVVRHLRKAFGRHTENLVTAFQDPSGNFNKPDPAEALVFWLTQLWKDPRRPLTGSGERIVLFPFDEKRLVDPAPNETVADGLYSYLPPDGKDAPYVYFDSRIYTKTSTAAACVYMDEVGGTALLYPYATQRNATAPLTMPNPTTFQIISAGLDGDYGDVSLITAGDPTTYKVFPFGTNFQTGDYDNIANFSIDGEKVIFEDHMQ